MTKIAELENNIEEQRKLISEEIIKITNEQTIVNEMIKNNEQTIADHEKKLKIDHDQVLNFDRNEDLEEFEKEFIPSTSHIYSFANLFQVVKEIKKETDAKIELITQNSNLIEEQLIIIEKQIVQTDEQLHEFTTNIEKVVNNLELEQENIRSLFESHNLQENK